MGVRNRDGALYFATGIDNTGMHRDAAETKNIVGGITDQVKKAGIVLGAVFGANTLSNFVQQIVKVRGEMQMLESSFETLLGSRSQADKLLEDIKKYAVESPLSLTSVSKATQTLLGFNIEADKTIPIIKQIGDISMGNQQRFESLTLAFSQMSSLGKLMGQDLNQMINAGFNPLQEISVKTGKSISELRSEMEKGAITSDMVADAFASATAEGGKFYGMTKKQAEGIEGWRAQIKGSVQEMFNELGKSSEKFITDTYKVTNSLIKNYETIGRAVMGLVATYGAYKAAVIAVTIAEGGWSVASMTQYRWLLLVEKAQKLLNATMLKNPFVAVTVAVVGLISVIATLSDKTTHAEKAQKKLNDALEEAKDRKEALRTKGNELITTLNSETATVYQQIKAYRELINLLPELKGRSIDDIKNMDSAELGRMLSNRSEQAEIDAIQARYEERLKNIEGYRKQIKSLIDAGADSATISYYREQLGIALEEAKGLKSQLDEIAEIQKQAFYQENPEEYRKDLQSQRVALLQKEAELRERIKAAGDNDLASANDRLSLQAVQSQIEKNKAALDALSTSADEAIIKNKAYWKSVLDEANAARDALSVDDVGSEEWNRLTNIIQSATQQLDHYSNKIKEVVEETKLVFRDVGTVEGVSGSIIESFLSSEVIDSIADRQISEYGQRLRESLTEVDLNGVDIFDILTSQLWNKAFSDLDKMAVDDMINLIHQLELHWRKLNLDPTELESLRNRIEQITDEIGRKNPFKGLSEAIKAYNSGSGNFKDIAKNAGAAIDQVGSMFNSVTDGLKRMGVAGDEETQKMLNGIGEMITGAATLAKGIATSNPAEIVAGSVQLLTSVIDVFDRKTRRANRIIEANKEQVEKLQKAYENLERAITKTYSTKAAALLEDEQRNLEQQKRLIHDNIAAEKRKKKPDRNTIKEWENLSNDIDVRIKENKDRILEALAGTDVMSAIDDFAQAYADAWTSGEKAAQKSADVVKSILRNALINYMKGQLQPEVDALMNKIADSMRDGKISEAEQKAIDALTATLDSKASKYESVLAPYLEDSTDKKSGVAGELQAAMTEGTATQLVGLWNMTALDIRAIKERFQDGLTINIGKDIYDIQAELVAINTNTKNTAENTDGIKDQFDKMNDRLEKIEKNTRKSNIR